MHYVDGFVTPVPTEKREAYLVFAEKNAAMFKELGALNVVECWEDEVPAGVNTSYPLAVKKRDAESVVFSWITWPSKDIRNAGWAKIMSDNMMRQESPPFDGTRLIYGGFKMIVNA